MTAQNEEKMREAFLNFRNDYESDYDKKPSLYETWQAAIAQEHIESQKRESALKESFDEMLKQEMRETNKAHDLRQVAQARLAESQKREAELQERVKELENLNKLMDEGMSAEHAKTIATLKQQLAATIGERVAYAVQKIFAWQCSATLSFKNGGFACCVRRKFHFGKHITHEQCGSKEF